MKLIDARKLNQEAQEALRKCAVKLVLSGGTHGRAAQAVGVARGTVSRWVSSYRANGESALDKKRRGRRPQEPRILTSKESLKVQGWIRDKCPDQLKLPFALWTRQAVRELIAERFGKTLALTTVGGYLKRWGFTPQKPAKRAYEQQPEMVKKWLDEEYPAIVLRAKAQQAEIYWGDETGLRSDCQYGRSFSPKGRTPVADYSGARFSTSMISAITNRGKLRFMVYRGGLKTDTFIVFLRRLIREAKGKIFLILDNLKVHHAKKTRQWVEKHKDRMALFFLPAYAPQYNPDEFLNNDVKQNVNKRRIPKNREELNGNLRSYLRSIQKKNGHIKSLFQAPTVRYAAV
jgi:transposase